MALQLIDLTTPQPGGKFGDPTKTAWEKTNDNAVEIEQRLQVGESGGAAGQQALAQVVALESDLGSAAYLEATALATATQGAKADTAVQPAVTNALQAELDATKTLVFDGSPIYDNVAAGLAATTNGQQFKVASTNPAVVAYSVYVRVSATVANLVTDVPSSETLSAKANVSDVTALRLNTGSQAALMDEAIGSNLSSLLSASATMIRANAEPIPYRAILRSASVRFRGAASGEIHVLQPRVGGTRTLSKYPISIGAAGVASVAMSDVVEAGAYVAYKPLTGPGLAYDSSGGSVPATGVAAWPVAVSTNVGDLQDPPTLTFTTRLSLQVNFSTTGEEALDTKVNQAETKAAAAQESAQKAASFLDLANVDSTSVSYGSVSGTYTGNAGAGNAYGPADASPGGNVKTVQAVYAGSGVVILEAQGADKVVIARHVLQFVDGVNTWDAGIDFPETYVPAGGHTYLRPSSGNNIRFATSGGSALSTAGFTQATAVGQTQEWSVSTVNVAMRLEYDALVTTLSDMIGPSFSPVLIDEDFSVSPPVGWTLVGATVGDGNLASPDSAVWTTKATATGYGKTLLMRRTLTVYAEIVAASQVWGIGFVRDTGGTTLDTPVAIVDGNTNQLRVYKWSGTTAPGASAAEIAVPWTLQGSNVRIDIKRVWFATTITLTNLLTGQAVQIVLDYTAGTGNDSGRPWGAPCVVFPSTTAAGVLVDRFRMVADYPFPSAKPARLLLIGDSITEGSQIGGTPNPEHNKVWSHLLEDERTAKYVRDTVVMGRGGQLSSHMVTALNEATAMCDKNTVVVILLGTNDAMNSVALTKWRANMTTILNALRKRTSRIALATLPPLGGTGASLRSQYNIDIISGYFGADLLPPVRFDLALSLNNDGVTWNPVLNSGDNIHPGVAGNQAMYERVKLDAPEVSE